MWCALRFEMWVLLEERERQRERESFQTMAWTFYHIDAIHLNDGQLAVSSGT